MKSAAFLRVHVIIWSNQSDYKHVFIRQPVTFELIYHKNITSFSRHWCHHCILICRITERISNKDSLLIAWRGPEGGLSSVTLIIHTAELSLTGGFAFPVFVCWHSSAPPPPTTALSMSVTYVPCVRFTHSKGEPFRALWLHSRYVGGVGHLIALQQWVRWRWAGQERGQLRPKWLHTPPVANQGDTLAFQTHLKVGRNMCGGSVSPQRF